MELVQKYFPSLDYRQISQFRQVGALYNFWNDRINVISRQDIDNIYEHHVLHSLSVSKFIEFQNGTRVLDLGTGGGFPGIPLAILFPDVHFHLIDSIDKKVKVAEAIYKALSAAIIHFAHCQTLFLGSSYHIYQGLLHCELTGIPHHREAQPFL